jgi:hypothetical protein
LDRFFLSFFVHPFQIFGMRPKIVIVILLAGAVGLAVIFFLKPSASHPQMAVVPIAQTQPAAPPLENKPVISQDSPAMVNATVTTPAHLAKSPPFTTGQVVGENAEYIQKQIDRLEELEANDDDASLQAILKELTNTNRLVRHEAIEATIQFGGHIAVPVLQDLAARTADPSEKKELQDAADFLALPTLTEVQAQDPNGKIVSPQ